MQHFFMLLNIAAFWKISEDLTQVLSCIAIWHYCKQVQATL